MTCSGSRMGGRDRAGMTVESVPRPLSGCHVKAEVVARLSRACECGFPEAAVSYRVIWASTNPPLLASAWMFHQPSLSFG